MLDDASSSATIGLSHNGRLKIVQQLGYLVVFGIEKRKRVAQGHQLFNIKINKPC